MKTVTPWITVYKYVHQSTHQGPLFQFWTWTDAYLSSPIPTPAYFSHAYTTELCIHNCWYCFIVRLLLPHEPPFLQVEIWITAWDSDGSSGQKGQKPSRRMEFCCVHTNCHVPLAILSCLIYQQWCSWFVNSRGFGYNFPVLTGKWWPGQGLPCN